MQNRFGLLNTDMMTIFMIIALDIVITLRFSINCSIVISSPTVLFSFKREASSETYGPWVYFHHIISRSIRAKPKNTLLQFIYIYFSLPFYLSFIPISIRSQSCSRPWRDWQPLFRVGCKLVFVCPGIRWLLCCLLLDWYLGSQTEGNTYLYFAVSPFPLQRKNQCKLKK